LRLVIGVENGECAHRTRILLWYGQFRLFP
jgi:hypothetical protein